MSLSATGNRLAAASFQEKASEINRDSQAELEAARRKHAGNLNTASLPAELMRVSARRMERLGLAWVDSFLEVAHLEKTLLSSDDIRCVLSGLEEMTAAGVASAIDAVRSESRATGHFPTGVEMHRARDAVMTRGRRRLEAHRLRYAVIGDRIDLKRLDARRKATENIPPISSEDEDSEPTHSVRLADAQYRDYVAAIEAVAREYLVAEETEPVDLESVSVESWLAEAQDYANALLDTEFGWLRENSSASDGRPDHIADQAHLDRNRLAGELQKRLRILATRRRHALGHMESDISPSSSPEWPFALSRPGPTERADGLPMLYKKNVLIELDLKAAAAFALDRGLPLALLMLDVDHFKTFNDRFGHAVGDEVLARIADVMCSILDGKGRAYRYGGEEMCVLAPNYTRDEAVVLADRIRRAIADIRIEGISAATTASFGVAIWPDDSGDLQDLVRNADAALYNAKEAGRNRVVAFRAASSS